MRIIPVLDLKGGEVVRAAKGQRDQYRPIVTPLSASPDVIAVADGLRTLYPFPTFYIADLDAIEGRGPNSAALARLQAMAQPPQLWVDAGFANAERLAGALAEPSISPVLGTESQQDDTLLRRFPWGVALAFGLLHGFGFAGALAEAGLPGGDIPLALLCFNVGIEVGQLAFVAAVLGIGAAIARWAPVAVARGAGVYAMGILAAYWCFERVAVWLS